MINKKMIPVIIILVILIVIIIIIVYNYNKKSKENKQNSDKLRQCKQQSNQQAQQCNQQVKQGNQQLQQYNEKAQKQLRQLEKDKSNLQKKHDWELAKSNYYTRIHLETKDITNNLLSRFLPNIDFKQNYGKTKLGYNPFDFGSLAKYIEEMKADQEASNSSKAVKDAMGTAQKGIMAAFYEAYKDNFNDQSSKNLLLAVGVNALNFAFACCGLGFLCGTLDGLIKKPGQAAAGQPQIAQQVVKQIEGYIAGTQASGQVTALNELLLSCNAFINTYNLTYKGLKARINCPYYATCPKTSDGSKCDFTAENTQIQTCISSSIYDPSVVKTSMYPNLSNREYLQNVLSTSGSTTYNQVTNPIPGLVSNQATLTHIDNVINTISDNAQKIFTTSQLYPIYIYTITYSITYYQELSLVDYSSSNGKYNNPYKSTYVGSANWGSNQTSGTLLGELFINSNKFYNFILTAFQTYYNNLTWTNNWTDNNKNFYKRKSNIRYYLLYGVYLYIFHSTGLYLYNHNLQ